MDIKSWNGIQSTSPLRETRRLVKILEKIKETICEASPLYPKSHAMLHGLKSAILWVAKLYNFERNDSNNSFDDNLCFYFNYNGLRVRKQIIAQAC